MESPPELLASEFYRGAPAVQSESTSWIGLPQFSRGAEVPTVGNDALHLSPAVSVATVETREGTGRTLIEALNMAMRIQESLYVRISGTEIERLKASHPEIAEQLDLRLFEPGADGQPPVFSTVLDLAFAKALNERGFDFSIDADLTAIPEGVLNTVSRENRFDRLDVVRAYDALDPAIATQYLNPLEIEWYLVNIATAYSSFAELRRLPHMTWEGRATHAIRIGAPRPPGLSRPTLVITSGLHGNEWPGPDICVGFVDILVKSAEANRDIVLGATRFPAPLLRAILDELDIVVFPNVNPDGREYSQTSGEQWRKNRNAISATAPHQVGVDVNRNFKFLWDLGYGASKEIHSPVYKGIFPESEPETRNVIHLVNGVADLRLFLDIHAHRQYFLHSWGNAPSQASNSRQSFSTCECDSTIGCNPTLGYREFMPQSYSAALMASAELMQRAMIDAGAPSYSIESLRNFYSGSVTGTSCDAVFSRNSFVEGERPRTIALALEVGTVFQPPYSEVRLLTKGVTAALLSACATMVTWEPAAARRPTLGQLS